MPIKGKISLGEFIRDVKKELKEAAAKPGEDSFFALTDVELEASFSLEAEGEVGMKFIVEAKGAATASQVHKVTLKFKTLAQDDEQTATDSSSADILQTITRGIGGDPTRLPGVNIGGPR